MNTISVEETQQRISELELAMNHPEYAEDYQFEFSPKLNPADFKHSGVREILAACEQLNVYMIPDVVLQMVEAEAYDKFTRAVKVVLEGKSTKYLMEMKNELERKMLKDQLEFQKGKLARMEAVMADAHAELPVAIGELDPEMRTNLPEATKEDVTKAEKQKKKK